jgi:signal transduction histidine kinase
MLKNDLQAQRLDQVEKDFERIAGAADKLDKLLSDLVELFRLERISNPYEEINLLQLTLDALETLDMYSTNVVVSVSPKLPVVYGDRSRLHKALVILIENAAKYTCDQPHPEITIGVRHEDFESTIFVQDNGLGIEPQYYDRIFNLFEQLNPTMEGNGLGLPLAKRIIELHGGRIWVESKGIRQGSTFFFTLPDNRHQDI